MDAHYVSSICDDLSMGPRLHRDSANRHFGATSIDSHSSATYNNPATRGYQRPAANSARAIFMEITLAEALRDYELVVILSPDIGDDLVPASLERLDQSVTSRGGEVKEVNHWGRRRMAYPIQRHIEGNYVVSQIRLDPGQVAALETNLRISEEVIRHMLVQALPASEIPVAPPAPVAIQSAAPAEAGAPETSAPVAAAPVTEASEPEVDEPAATEAEATEPSAEAPAAIEAEAEVEAEPESPAAE